MKLKSAIGRSEYKKYQDGIRITPGQAIRAKCYECMGFYADGRVDCQIVSCPLHGFMPYKQKGVKHE